MFLVLMFLAGLAGAHAQTTATVGVPFSNKIASPTNLGYIYTTNGAQNVLPPDLVYSNSTGILSGIPKAIGTYSIVLQQATTTLGVYTTSTFNLNVVPAGSGTTVPPPPPPATFCATSTKPNCGVNLSWSAPASPKDPVIGYLVFRATGSSSSFVQLTSAKITATTYVDATVAASTAYSYYIVSVDSAGALSVPSNTAAVTIPAVVVTPPPAPDPPTGLTAVLVLIDGTTGS